jgi:hypothetical protein
MNNFIPTYTDISAWELQIYQNTTGSRSKKIAIHPETNREYFFKGSKELETGEIRYPTEFWSEIVSSKIGQLLGFEMLDYNIAFHKHLKQKIGCLSESMVLHTENKLTEGKVFLTGFDSNYKPETDKKKYTFQFIIKTLAFFDVKFSVQKIIEIIVFDAIIGNSDRHQENWGIISSYVDTLNELGENLVSKKHSFYEKMKIKLRIWYTKLLRINSINGGAGIIKNKTLQVESLLIKTKFSPIYDSGCCLGRELTDEKIQKMLQDDQMLKSYINKGESEIHWETFDSKRKHFDLLELLIVEHKRIVSKIIKNVLENYDSEKVENLIENIDINLPESLSLHRLTADRKKLMIKLITLRVEKLRQLL